MPWTKLNHLSEVPRWTVVPTIRKQNVAEHSFHVSWIALWLVTRHEGMAGEVSAEFASNVLQFALRHDEDEAITGDVPTTAKRDGIVKVMLPKHNVPEMARDLVKLADFIEAYRFMEKERLLGNSLVALRMQSDLCDAIEKWGKEPKALTPKDVGVEKYVHLFDISVNAVPVMALPGMGD